MSCIAGRRIVLTGGGGFLGQAVCRELANHQPAEVHAPRRAEFDLRDRQAIQALLHQSKPDVIIHLAAVVGGIGANRQNPGYFFYENAIMGIELIEQARLAGVEKITVAGTICSYPKHTPVPFREADLWAGYPEETNAPYGLAKKMLIVQSQAYRQQYGLNAINVLPVNIYGPGDNFDPQSSHVIPALIRKVHQAKQAQQSFIEVWGTGTASREFLFVRDAARGIVMATDQYDSPEPVNLGSGDEITIRDLVSLICELSDWNGEIRWDKTQPDGQPRRCLDTNRARQEFGFESQIGLRQGLQETIDWYVSTTGSA